MESLSFHDLDLGFLYQTHRWHNWCVSQSVLWVLTILHGSVETLLLPNIPTLRFHVWLLASWRFGKQVSTFWILDNVENSLFRNIEGLGTVKSVKILWRIHLLYWMTGVYVQTRLVLVSLIWNSKTPCFGTVVQSSLRFPSPKHQDYEDCKERRVRFLFISLFSIDQSPISKVRLFLLESWWLVYDY